MNSVLVTDGEHESLKYIQDCNDGAGIGTLEKYRSHMNVLNRMGGERMATALMIGFKTFENNGGN